MRHPLIWQSVANTPWAIEPGFAERFLAVLERQVIGQGAPAPQAAIVAEDPGQRTASPGGSVMVLPLMGLISYRGGIDEACQPLMSVVKFGAAFDKAVADPNITAIVIDVDSPGGDVSGIPELATKIFSARGTKPIIAVANTLCASAAYWLACACDEIVVTPSAEIGSIGVYMLHYDQSEYDASLGVKVTLIKAGEYKGEGISHFPLAEETSAYIQGRVDEWYRSFTGAVATMRGVTPKEVREGFGQGRTVGAKAAVGMRMADRIATLDEVVAKLVTKGKRTGGGRAEIHSGGPRAEQIMEVTDAPAPALPEVAAAPRGGAAAAAVASTVSAAEAKEQKMTEEEKAALAAEAKAAEQERGKSLAALARQHGLTAELPDWLESGKSVAQVKDDILASKAVGSRSASPATPVATVHAPNEGKKPFESFGHQLKAIMAAGIAMKQGRAIDPRLHFVNEKMQAASGATEGSGSDAGFAIDADFVLDLMSPLYERGILSRVRRVAVPAGKSSVKIARIEETSRVTGSRLGGVQMFWKAEGDAPTPKKPKMGKLELDLKKLIGLAYASDELEEDANYLGSVLAPSFSQELEFMCEDAVLRGLGSGMPAGVIPAACTVTQAIEGTETLANQATFLAINIAKMLSRIPGNMQNDVVFFYHPSLLPYLVTTTVGGTAAVPVFLPGNGMAGKPFDTIFGRPAIMSELCEAPGTPGDIIAAALSQYAWADKSGPKQATSIHLKFDTDETAFRLTYRADGQPIWKSAITPYKGADTLSPFVLLNTRS